MFTSSAPTVPVGQEVMVTGTVDRVRSGRRDRRPAPVDHRDRRPNTSSRSASARRSRRSQIGGAGQSAPPTEGHGRGRGLLGSARGHAGQGQRLRSRSARPPAFGEIYTVVDNDDNPANGLNATGLTSRGTIQFTPGTPEADDPGTVGTNSLRTTNTIGGDFNPERIQIDDDSGVHAGFSSPRTSIRARALSDVTGVVSYNFGNYEVVATQAYHGRAGQHAGEGDDDAAPAPPTG